MYQRVIDLKVGNPKLKVLIAVGGKQQLNMLCFKSNILIK